MVENIHNSLINNNFNFHADKVETGALIIALAGVAILFLLYEDYRERKHLKRWKHWNSKNRW